MKSLARVVLVCAGICFIQPALAQTQPSHSSVCKAAIGAIMGRDPAIISAEPSGDIVSWNYVRPNDKTVWGGRCRIAGNTIVWQTTNGRWRDHPADELITWRLAGSQVVIRQKFSDGSIVDKSFDRSTL